MTHRVFWMTVGAGLGISGYRRANRALKGLVTVPGLRRPQLQHGGAAARFLGPEGLTGFARDVRDGMDLYTEQQRLNIERRRATGAPIPVRPELADGTGASRDSSPAPRARH